MPDGQEPKKPGRGKIDLFLVFFVILAIEVTFGPFIGVVLGSIWPWPF